MSQEFIDIGPHAAEDLWISSLIHLPATVILYYDYILTLSREIEFLWPPHNKQGWFTVACLLNRYIPIFGYLPTIVSYFIPSDIQFCVGLNGYFAVYLIVIMQLNIAVLCVIRVYALYSQSRRVLGFLTFTALISGVTGAFFASRRNENDIGPVSSSFIGCSPFTASATGRYLAIAWACMSGFDIVIFSLTLYKAFKIGRGIRLLDTIVRDGAMYFFALFIMNLINILACLHSSHFLKSSASRLTNVLSTTLISRMALNLREQNSTVVNLPTTVETEHGFQAALPSAQQSTISVEDSPSVYPSNSAC